MATRTARPGPLYPGAGPTDRTLVLRALTRERFGTVDQLAREAHTRPRRWPSDTPAAVGRRRRALLEWS